MDLNDTDRLRHIRAAASSIGRATRSETYEAFVADEFRLMGFFKLLQDIGEAASRMTPIGIACVPGVPWSRIIRMRHRLVHDYYKIDLRVVYDVVHDHVPDLLKAVEVQLRAREAD